MQDGDLVPQHEELDILDGGRATHQQPISRTSPSTCQKIEYDNATTLRDHVRPPITAGQRPVASSGTPQVIFFHLLADPTAEFTDLGADFYAKRIDRARRTTHLLRQLHALGYQVQLTDTAAA